MKTKKTYTYRFHHRHTAPLDNHWQISLHSDDGSGHLYPLVVNNYLSKDNYACWLWPLIWKIVINAILTVFNLSFVFHLTEMGHKSLFINTHAIKATSSLCNEKCCTLYIWQTICYPLIHFIYWSIKINCLSQNKNSKYDFKTNKNCLFRIGIFLCSCRIQSDLKGFYLEHIDIGRFQYSFLFSLLF